MAARTWVQNYNNDPNAPGAGNSLPLGGHKNGMTFSNATTGWVGGDIPTNGYVYFYKTIDSGVTWTLQPLPIPAGYENAYMITTAPKFFGANDGVLAVRMTLDVGGWDLFIYSTHNGGATWSISSAFVHQGRNTDFITMNDGITWDVTGMFHATNNAGASWSNITPNINFGDDMPDMDFVSTTTGWLIQNQVNGSTPLYRTSDGGATWTLLSPNQPAPTPVAGTLTVQAIDVQVLDYQPVKVNAIVRGTLPDSELHNNILRESSTRWQYIPHYSDYDYFTRTMQQYADIL